jgi:hypothetical protein
MWDLTTEDLGEPDFLQDRRLRDVNFLWIVFIVKQNVTMNLLHVGIFCTIGVITELNLAFKLLEQLFGRTLHGENMEKYLIY